MDALPQTADGQSHALRIRQRVMSRFWRRFWRGLILALLTCLGVTLAIHNGNTGSFFLVWLSGPGVYVIAQLSIGYPAARQAVDTIYKYEVLVERIRRWGLTAPAKHGEQRQ